MGVFGDNLRAYCVMHHLGRGEIADAANVPKETVSRWVNGAREPQAAKIQLVADALKVPPEPLRELRDGFASQLVERLIVARWDCKRAGLPTSVQAERDVSALRRRFEGPWGGVVPRRRARIPLLTIDDFSRETLSESFLHTEVPLSILEASPLCYGVIVPDTSLVAIAPPGAQAIVDPGAKPANGAVGLAVTKEPHACLRRVFVGSDKVLLSAASIDASPVGDLVLDKGEIELLGRVVWWQRKG